MTIIRGETRTGRGEEIKEEGEDPSLIMGNVRFTKVPSTAIKISMFLVFEN